MSPNTLLAMFFTILVLQIAVMVAQIYTAIQSRKTAEMAAVFAITDMALGALVANRYHLENSIRDVLADTDYTARTIIEGREGAGYDQWVRKTVTRLHSGAAQKPQ